MPGFTLKSLKAHYALVPLFGVTVMGFSGAMYYLGRLATRCPEVGWKNPTIKTPKEHWQRYKPTDQYKFYSPTRDYSKERFPPERPKLD
ncbi:hypothetical protein SNE40_009914 [Patella caerulea]